MRNNYTQAFPQLGEENAGVVDLPVRVKAKAAHPRVRIDYDGDNRPFLRVDVTSPPEKGKANRDVCKLLAKELGMPKSALEIVKGAAAPDKVVRLSR